MLRAVGIFLFVLGLFGFFKSDLTNTLEVVTTWVSLIAAIACMAAAIYREE